MRLQSRPNRLTMRTLGWRFLRPIPACAIAFFVAALPHHTTAYNGFAPLVSTAGPQAAIAQGLSTNLEPEAHKPTNDAQQRVLGHLLYRSRRHQLLLSRATRHLAEGKTADAFLYLQTLIDASQDSFTWLREESRLVSVRAESMRLLGSQPQRILQTYERIHRAEAELLLAEARLSGDPHQFRELGRRFYFTSAGFEAMNWQASRWFDLGNMGQAARVWKRLATEPAHQHRVTRAMLLKTAIALRLNGETAEAGRMMKRLGNRGVVLGNGELADQEWLVRNATDKSISTRLANRVSWPVQNEQAARRQTTTPFLSAAWSQSYSLGRDELLTDLVTAWQKRQRDNLKPIAVANSAVVADDTIILRDFGRIRAFDSKTGESRWSYDCASSLKSVSRQSLSRVASRGRTSSSTSVDVRNAFAANGTMGMLSSDGERVYAVDYVDLTRKHQSRGRFSRSSQNLSDKQPQLISREANRLIALAVHPADQGEQPQRPLWSIGGAVGTPEWFVQMDRDFDGRVSKKEFTDKADRFSAIDTNHDSAIGLREAAAAAGFSDRRNPLWGHFFLGAPLAANDRIYAVTEADRQLNLVALKPESGELLWSQAIGYVEIPIERDANRYSLQCTPSFADGILICPTQLGFLVGIDSSTGSLLWAYYYGDEQSLSRLGRWPHRPQRNYGHAGFPAVIHIAGDRVVVLPRQSDEVHCLDLKAGTRVWTNPRQDAEYIGTISDGQVLLVGSRQCRGISLDTGKDQWATRMGMPSGRGVQAGNHYLLPLQSGRIATLDLLSGNEIGFTIAQSRQDTEEATNDDQVSADESAEADGNWYPGNLVAVGNLVLSAGAHRLVAFPQAGALLTSIEKESRNQPMSPQKTVLTAELNLALGHMDVARKRLTEVLSTPMPQADVQRAETLLRELLYLQLRQQTDNVRLFAQLEQLSKTPTRRGRYLMQRAEAQMKRADFAGVLRSTRDFSSLNLNRPLPTVDDPSLRVTAASWVRSIVGRVQDHFGDEQLAEITAHVNREQQLALSANETRRLEQFLAVYSQWPQADMPRSELARRYIAAGEFQKAELLLLTNRDSQDRLVARKSTAMLAGLWDRLGLWHEAAGLINEDAADSTKVNISDGESTRELLPEFSPSGLTAYALRQREFPNWNISRVDILERPWSEHDPQLAATYGRYRRRFAARGQSTYQLLVKGTRGTEELAIIDRQTGRIVSKIPITHHVSYPSTQHMTDAGHFVPLGGPAELNGISLLTGESQQRLWTTHPPGLASRREVLRVGPAGPTFCSFQGRRMLVVTDPGSGRILWQRTDLDPRGGLLNDPYAGLFGDDQALVLFAADRVSYTVYKTATGEVLRNGRLDVEVNQQRRVFGRKLCYVTRKGNATHIRIWDPLHDRVELDETFEGRLYSAVTPEKELAVILPNGRLVIVDVAGGRKRLDVKLAASDLANLNYMRVFSSNGRYLVNLQRAVQRAPSHTYHYYASDTFLDAVHIQGELLAFDQKSHQLDWRRTLPQRSVIRTPQFGLPFLTMMSGVRDRRNGNRQSLLIEVIDAATGETIGLKSNIRPDRIVQCNYQPELGTLQLHGLKSLIELKFDEERQRLSMDDLPL